MVYPAAYGLGDLKFSRVKKKTLFRQNLYFSCISRF